MRGEGGEEREESIKKEKKNTNFIKFFSHRFTHV